VPALAWLGRAVRAPRDTRPAFHRARGRAGKQAAYLGESSNKYENHLKVALRSIRENCPSIVPVVVTLNDVPERTKRAFTALGATVVKHELTISKHVYKTAALDEWSWIKGVISTYLRVEIHLIVKENRHLFNAAQVDTQYVIWGDLDTIWLRNFDSCTLAKPTLLSVSGCARSRLPALLSMGNEKHL